MNLDLCLGKKNTRKKYTGHLLAERLDAYIRTGKRRPYSSNTKLLNWGRSKIVDLSKYDHVLNDPVSVHRAIDKSLCLKILSENSVPRLDWIDSINLARYIVGALGTPIYCRTLTRSRSGKGIVIAKTVDEVVPAPLYTIHYNQDKEFRYHIFQGKVIDIQQKKRMNRDNLIEHGIKIENDHMIRNTANGYIFAREGIHYYQEVADICIAGVQALNLDFAAVDVLVKTDNHDNYHDAVICEINTAPALTGTTLESYINSFKEFYTDLGLTFDTSEEL